jgi:hypothetical protein
VSAGHNPVVDESVADEVVEGLPLDDELDRVASEPDEADDVVGEAEASPDGTGDEGGNLRQRRGLKMVVGGLLALGVAAAAVWVAGGLGGSTPEGLPQTVTDPAVVLGALEDGGIACGGAAVSGNVATCNATVAVRVFGTPDEADRWVTDLLRDPMTSSAIGWVTHGNVVVAAPLNGTPEVAAALGPESQIY